MEKKVFFEKCVFMSWIFVIGISVIIFYLSSLSIQGGKQANLNSYIYHFFVFFWLAFFLLIAMTKGRNINLALPAIIIAIAYALSDEIHQKFIPFRSCSFPDFLIDSAGILFASLLYLFTLRIRQKSTV